MLIASPFIFLFLRSCNRSDEAMKSWVATIQNEIPGGINLEGYKGGIPPRYSGIPLLPKNPDAMGALAARENPELVAELRTFSPPLTVIVIGDCNGGWNGTNRSYEIMGQGISADAPSRLLPDNWKDCRTLVLLRGFSYDWREVRRGAGGHGSSDMTYFLTFYDLQAKRRSNTYRFYSGWSGGPPPVYGEVRDFLDFLYPASTKKR